MTAWSARQPDRHPGDDAAGTSDELLGDLACVLQRQPLPLAGVTISRIHVARRRPRRRGLGNHVGEQLLVAYAGLAPQPERQRARNRVELVDPQLRAVAQEIQL